MTKEQFVPQMNRLVTSFEAHTYGPERTKLIYNEVKMLTVKEFTKIVDEFIGRNSFRYPPLVPAFREAALLALKAREKYTTKEVVKKLKEKNSPTLHQYLNSLGASSIWDAVKKLKS